MGFVTVRGRDSAEAMALVIEKLGQDAMILSTETRDGHVLMTATSDDLAASTVPPGPRAPAAPVAAPDLAAAVDAAPATPLGTPTGAPQGDAPAPQSFAAHLPSFLRPGATPFRLQAAEAPAASDPVPSEPEKTGEITQERVLAAARIVLMGPLGAGKSHVALQLAAAMLDAEGPRLPGFVFHGSGSHGDGAYLAKKSALLGVPTLFETAVSRPPPEAGTPEIVVLSALARDPAGAGQALLAPAGALGLLVLPAGLRPDRMAALATAAGGRARGIVLTTAPGAPVEPADLEGLRGLGLPVLWIARRDRLLNGLSPPDAGQPDPEFPPNPNPMDPRT